MTPKEKANELVKKHYGIILAINPKFGDTFITAKQCALIAVDEMINYCSDEHIDYLEQVKQEIQSL